MFGLSQLKASKCLSALDQMPLAVLAYDFNFKGIKRLLEFQFKKGET